MKILFTGASAFTGYWFVKQLAESGHEVIALFRRPAAEYTDVRAKRVAALAELCKPVYGVSFGTEGFIRLVQQGGFEILAHHAADVTDYKSPDFKAVDALAANTQNIAPVLNAFATAGGRAVVLTGSVFENDEGAGSEGLPAFSPYGLSKALTAQMFRFYAAQAKLALGKFVIPNPFGPFEEPRFTAYLMKNWFAGKIPSVQTPAHVRDNIHVSLLARAYSKFVESMASSPTFVRLNPSGYIESQGAFALRFANEMRSRLSLECGVELKTQTTFTEPRIRVNTDPADAMFSDWSESPAWDQLAAYYVRLFGNAAGA